MTNIVVCGERSNISVHPSQQGRFCVVPYKASDIASGQGISKKRFQHRGDRYTPRFENGFHFQVRSKHRESFFLRPFSSNNLRQTRTSTSHARIRTLVSFRKNMRPISFERSLLRLINSGYVRTTTRKVRFRRFRVNVTNSVINKTMRATIPNPLIRCTREKGLTILRRNGTIFKGSNRSRLISRVKSTIISHEIYVMKATNRRSPSGFLLFSFLRSALHFRVRLRLMFFSDNFYFALNNNGFATKCFRKSRGPFRCFVRFYEVVRQRRKVRGTNTMFHRSFVRVNLSNFQMKYSRKTIRKINSTFVKTFISTKMPSRVQFSPNRIVSINVKRFSKRTFKMKESNFRNFNKSTTSLSKEDSSAMTRANRGDVPVERVLMRVRHPKSARNSSYNFLKKRTLPIRGFIVFPTMCVKRKKVKHYLSNRRSENTSFTTITHSG